MCSIPLTLGKGFTIGVKGYGLVIQQRAPAGRKMANLGESYEETISHTVYEDAVREITALWDATDNIR